MVSVPVEEIRRSPVEVGSLSHYLQGFIRPRWLAGFLPSTVVHINFTPNDRFEYPPRELYNISHFTQEVGKIIDPFQCRKTGWDGICLDFFCAPRRVNCHYLQEGHQPPPRITHRKNPSRRGFGECEGRSGKSFQTSPSGPRKTSYKWGCRAPINGQING